MNKAIRRSHMEFKKIAAVWITFQNSKLKAGEMERYKRISRKKHFWDIGGWNLLSSPHTHTGKCTGNCAHLCPWSWLTPPPYAPWWATSAPCTYILSLFSSKQPTGSGAYMAQGGRKCTQFCQRHRVRVCPPGWHTCVSQETWTWGETGLAGLTPCLVFFLLCQLFSWHGLPVNYLLIGTSPPLWGSVWRSHWAFGAASLEFIQSPRLFRFPYNSQKSQIRNCPHVATLLIWRSFPPKAPIWAFSCQIHTRRKAPTLRHLNEKTFPPPTTY